jgi:DNA-binding response OmpR family regulator
MAKILLVEDEINISSFIERGLQEFGHEVFVASNGKDAWGLIEAEKFQFLILDIVVPLINGLELCKMYREKFGYQTPVVMLTALGTTEDIIKGLDVGADDYLVKPFRFLELEARIRALLRRSGVEDQPEVLLQCGDLQLDPDNRRAVRQGKNIHLTIREYRMLEYLVRHKGNAVSREDLLKYVWEDKEIERSNVVDVYVNYLRGKIDKGFKRKMIQTVTGVGYMIGG